MIILDNFLPTAYMELKRHSQECEFKDEVNPIDGVVYPNICLDIPEPVRNELYWYLGAILHRKPKDPMVFMRMSQKGVKCPHTYHNDSSHGLYSMMLYLDDRKDAGTALARHKETGAVRPNEGILQKVVEDQNNHSKWEVYKTAEMRENRAVVFDSSLFHCALPFGGYGENQKDSRIVLTAFFS